MGDGLESTHLEWETTTDGRADPPATEMKMDITLGNPQMRVPHVRIFGRGCLMS